MKIVGERKRIDRAVLVFQREVADRLTAAPGSKAYGPLTVLVGQAFDVRVIESIPPGAFRPRPEVTSTATLWKVQQESPLDEGIEERLRACLEASFAHRRQTLLRNLRQVLGESEARQLLLGAEIDPGLRAEAVPPAGWLRLARLWPERVGAAVRRLSLEP
jgi:16S rRNA (adenine1518-N6/adenine1519-N6)-dimethyltransferase